MHYIHTKLNCFLRNNTERFENFPADIVENLIQNL